MNCAQLGRFFITTADTSPAALLAPYGLACRLPPMDNPFPSKVRLSGLLAM